MSLLHTLRTTRSLARGVLLWWCLALALAAAAPLAQAHDSRMVCSASGMVMLVDADTGAPASQGAHSLDCALCLVTGAPPLAAHTDFSVSTSTQALIARTGPNPHTRRSAAPPPGRGPPAQT